MNEYKTFAESFARFAGDSMRRHFKLGVSHTMKEDRSPVTAADLEINSFLVEEVAKHFPDHSVLGEELSDLKEGSEYTWVCDPIDGTRPFSHGLPIATSSLALVRNGESILGLIHDPFTERTYFAEKGAGATLNGATVHVSDVDSLYHASGNMETGRRASYDLIDLVRRLIKEEQAVLVHLGSIAISGALVAAGEYEFAIFPYRSAHDIAAAKIIVEEAGGRVTDLYGNEQRYDRPIHGALMTNGRVHEALLADIGALLSPTSE